MRENEFYRPVPQVLPIKIGNYIYYRNINNQADALTLYRFPIDELQSRGFTQGDIPFQKGDEVDFPEEESFNLKDLTLCYQDFTMLDERFKAFVEKLTDLTFVENTQTFHYFQINEEQQIAVLFFDTEQNGKTLDIIVKDLSIDRLLPVLILNTDGEVAFDKFSGFYYTQVDAQGRGYKIFRHQVGQVQS